MEQFVSRLKQDKTSDLFVTFSESQSGLGFRARSRLEDSDVLQSIRNHEHSEILVRLDRAQWDFLQTFRSQTSRDVSS